MYLNVKLIKTWPCKALFRAISLYCVFFNNYRNVSRYCRISATILDVVVRSTKGFLKPLIGHETLRKGISLGVVSIVPVSSLGVVSIVPVSSLGVVSIVPVSGLLQMVIYYLFYDNVDVNQFLFCLVGYIRVLDKSMLDIVSYSGYSLWFVYMYTYGSYRYMNCCIHYRKFIWRCLYTIIQMQQNVNSHIYVIRIYCNLQPYKQYTPFAKSNGRFFQTQKSTWCLDPICKIFSRSTKCILPSSHFFRKIYWLLALTRYAPMFKGDERNLLKLSLNIFVNFMEWNLTDSGEILPIVILTRCLNLNLVQISWRLATLLQNHSRKGVGHCVHL